MQTPLQIFASYAKEDREYYEQLETTARQLVRQGIVALWNPHDAIPAGTSVREEISQHLQEASLIFLLFSPDSLADDACYAQIQQAIQIGEREPDRVWIILLRPCGWKEIWEAIEHKGHFHFLPRNCRPLSNWPIPDRDDIAQDIASEITEFVRRTRQRDPTAEGPVTPPVVRLPNPYRGLLSFRIEDAPFFYGRERLTSEVLEKITDMLTPRNMQKAEQLLPWLAQARANPFAKIRSLWDPTRSRGGERSALFGVEPGTRRGTSESLENNQKADVRARFLRSASPACPSYCLSARSLRSCVRLSELRRRKRPPPGLSVLTGCATRWHFAEKYRNFIDMLPILFLQVAQGVFTQQQMSLRVPLPVFTRLRYVSRCSNQMRTLNEPANGL